MIICVIAYICAALAMFILVKQLKYLEYYVKIIAISIGTILITSILILPYLPFRPKDYRNGFVPCWVVRQWMRFLGVTFELRGADHINVKRGGVVLINHQSFIDVGVLCALWPFIGRLRPVSKNAMRYAFPPSYCYGTLYIHRNNHRDTVEKLNQQNDSIQNDAAKLIMFPEGTRNQSGRLLPFKKGPFHVAIQSQSSIQPVVVSRYDFLDSKQKIFKSGHSIISVLPEIDCSGMNVDNVTGLLERCQNLMQEEFERISSCSTRLMK